MGRVHRILRWIIFIAAGVVGVAMILVLAGPGIRSWQVERAIARFEKRPSPDGADSLVELLQMHAATGEQGKRALTLLLHPKIVTRKAYAAGRPVTIAVERPFKLDFRTFLWNKEVLSINGLPTTPQDGFDTVEHATSCLNVPGSHTQPGVYPIELRIQRSFGVERASRATTVLRDLHDGLPWLIPDLAVWQASRTYECDFTVSSEVIVAGDNDAEKVELVSSAEFDQAMQAAFSIRYAGLSDVLWTPDGRQLGRNSVYVFYKDIPLAAAFSAALRLADGREVPVRGTWPRVLSARAGSSGSFTIDPSSFAIDTPGQHKATLVLVPDPDAAYLNAAINRIWNGTLEFPISFTIDAVEPGR